VIADLTGWSRVPQELQAIAPTLAVPIQALLFAENKQVALPVEGIQSPHWALPVSVYNTQADSLTVALSGIFTRTDTMGQITTEEIDEGRGATGSFSYKSTSR
jgi:hypothetical protein